MKVAILSDIHANIFALQAVYEDMDSQGVEHVLVSGDLVGYYYWPGEVVRMIRDDSRTVCIAGNHEHILRDIISHPESAEGYRRKYGSGYDACFEQLSDDEVEWLLGLPDEVRLQCADKSFYMSHGGFESVDRYLYPDASSELISKNYSDCDFSVYGHTHYPFLHSSHGRFLVNPGSVGQPRDTGGLASYVVVDLANTTIRFRRKAFDSSSILNEAKIRDPGLVYLSKVMVR